MLGGTALLRRVADMPRPYADFLRPLGYLASLGLHCGL